MSKEKSANSLRTFFVGLLLLGAGLYMIASQVHVTSAFGSFRLGGFRVPFGMTTVPLIIGIIWLFVKPDSVLPKIVLVLGTLFVLVAIIMSVRLFFSGTTLYEYLLMFGMTAAGFGLLLRTLFAGDQKHKKEKKDSREE